MCASNDFGCLLIWTSSDVVVNRFEIQVIRLSIDLRCKRFGCQLIWDSSDLDVKWFEVQVIWLSTDVWFKWFCQTKLFCETSSKKTLWSSKRKLLCETSFKNEALKIKSEAFLRDFLPKWSFEAQRRSFCARLPSKLKLWRSKTKLFCETSFKNEALKIKNTAFLRDFLQNWSFEDQKRSFSARLPSKLKLWRSKTKLFCEISFQNEALKLKEEAFLRDFLQKWSFKDQKTKLFCETSFKIEALKIKNEAFLRDFLQNWSFEDKKRSFSGRLPSKMKLWKAQRRSFCARLPSKMKLWRSKTKHFCETSFKNDMLTGHWTSEFQYVLTIFKWMLQKYCACHEKVEPSHTKSCNCHAKWSLQSNTSVTWNLQPFHGFCVGGFKHRHHKARTHCACHAKRIVSDPLQIHHVCQRFCNPHELLRLPRILQPVEIPAPATQNALSTSKNVPSTWCFNDFDFQIALARRRGANFAKLNFQKCSEPTVL